MSVLVVGLSHHTASVDLLERVSTGVADFVKALHELQNCDYVEESLVLSTCNRVEIYAHVSRFHGGVTEVSELLSRLSGVPLDELSDALYVHYEDRAVSHLFTVACGLDSMVLGEGQILGQLRGAFRMAQDEGSIQRVLGELLRHSLRVGKRARTETGIGRAGASLVAVGLQLAEDALGPLDQCAALVVGAGSMAALAGSTLRRQGIKDLAVANRTAANAESLAASEGGRAVALAEMEDAIAGVDLVVSTTGAAGVVVPADVVRRAMARRPERSLFLLDLALPRDVDPGVRQIPGVHLVDLEVLGESLQTSESQADADEVRRIVVDEVAAFLGWQRAVRVAPTVAALRAKADALIAGELTRLESRGLALDARQRAEVEQTVRRVVDKLLHAPSVRVKQLAETPGGDLYAEALRELFGLDPQVTEAVSAAVSVPTHDEEGR